MRLRRDGSAPTFALALGLALLGRAAPAQQSLPPTDLASRVVESWSIADGLPTYSINALLQSRSGYLYAATFDGLVRFDGDRFTVFNSANTPGLPSDRIITMLEARDGTLWLNTEQRVLVRFRDGRFTAIDRERGLTGQVHAIHEDLSGRLWVGTTDGLGEVRDGRFVPVASDAIRGTVLSILRRRDGTLWAGTASRGLFRIAGDRVERMSTGTELETMDVERLFEDPLGRLWIYAERPNQSGAVWMVPGNSRPARAGDWQVGVVAAFAWVPAWRTVVGHSQVGIFRFEPGALTALLDRPRGYTLVAPMQVRGADSVWYAADLDVYVNERRVFSLPRSNDVPQARITDLQFDTHGDLWLATAGLGLLRLRRSDFTVLGAPEGLDAVNAYSIAQDSAGGLWVGSIANGISHVAPDRRTIRNFGPLTGHSDAAGAIVADGPDRLVITAGQTVEECTLPALRCRTATLPASAGDGVFALHRVRDGRILAGTDGHVFERVDGRWRVLPGWRSRVRARAFAETPDGALWIGTNGEGVVRCRGGRCRTIGLAEGLPSALVRALHVDADGWLWIGTEGRGLVRLDPRGWPDDDARHRPAIVRYGTEEGLFDPVVHHILEDGLGRFWFNSNRGIYWVSRADLLAFAEGRVARIYSTAYTERDGLRNREGNGGYQPAGVRDGRGVLWFPTQAGIVGVDPKTIPSGRTPPPVVVEQVATRTRAVPVDTAGLRLDATERDLEIAYTAFSFREPGNVRFRYRLDPYDADWVEPGRRRTAFYTRVPPGRYVFRVAASLGGDEWSEHPAVATIEIAPYFHETPAAKALLALALLLLGLAGLRWRERALRRREAELTAVVAERTAALRRNEQELAAQNAKLAQLHQLRSRLFANLSHEFRTPLTLILGPLRSLLDGRQGPLAAGVREQAELMHRNGQRLLRLINQILDLARLQAGAVAISRQPVELVEYVRTLAHAFLPLAERQGIAVVVRSPLRAVTVAADAEQLEKVLLNLLSNAVKFTGAGGMVDVAVTAEDDHAVITVRDTGIGIGAEDLPHIFERFYQAESGTTRRFDGTGIGLALARELVELHGGEISAASVPGEGSTFTVRLPLGIAATPGAAAPAPSGAALDELLRAQDAEPAPLAPATDEAGDDRPTVLLVDDNTDIRAYVRTILAGEFHVLEAADGRAGLALAREALPDLIVADVMMPELDGLGLGRALKEDPMTDAIPVILLTARAASEDQIAGLDAGADAYLVKPFDPGVLVAAAGNLLAQRRRLRERLRSGETAVPAADPAEPAPLDRQLRPLVLARLLDPGFNPEALAAAAGLSYHQLYRSLRDDLGTTPSRYIRTVRAECAADLLRRGAGSVTEIAYAVGFESLSYFRRAFRERFDRTPSEFLAANAAEQPPQH